MPRALPYLLLLPATVFLCVFFLYPFVLVAAESLTRGGAWTLENYQRMVTHWKFGVTFRNTLMLAAVVVPVQLAMALAMASMVTRLETGRSAILYIFAIPLGISDLAAGLIWLAIFEQSGFLNSFLSAFGLPGIAASAVFAFVISWNEVFAAAVLTIENRTPTAFLLQSLNVSPLPLKFAGGAALVLPALIFIFAVRDVGHRKSLDSETVEISIA